MLNALEQRAWRVVGFCIGAVSNRPWLRLAIDLRFKRATCSLRRPISHALECVVGQKVEKMVF